MVNRFRKNSFNFLFIFTYLVALITKAQTSIITEKPYIESTNTNDAKIEKIEITDKYTILFMSFEMARSGGSNDRSGKGNKALKDLLDILMGGNLGGLGSRNQPSAYISIRPSSSLIALNGDRTFKYIKASGIPEEPEKLDVFYGEKLNFKLYYERVDPGITVFDFFEGHNSDQVKCWNYYKVHITNPDTKLKQIEKMDSIKVNPMFLVTGKVLDAKTKKPVLAKLEYLLSPKMKAVDSTMTFWNTGTYKTKLMALGIYNCIISAPGYLIMQDNFELEAKASNTFKKDYYLTPIVKGDLVRLNSVYFETSEHELLTASYSELNKLVILMNANPSLKILLEGHTDTVGDKQANVELSQRRVNSVRKYLLEKGITPDRIETKGWGSAKPINANGTDEERKVNRRVEFRILNL